MAELRRQRDISPTPTGPNAIEGRSKEREDERPRRAPLAPALAYTVDRSGNVTYYADQEKRRALVIDSGQQVTVAADKDSQAVEAGLRLAVQKFGPGLKIEGSEEFKRQVIEVALKSGLRVEFDSKDMNEELQRPRAERDELQARGRAFIDAEREKGKAARTPTPATEKAPEQTQERIPEPPPAPKKSRDFER